MMDVEKKRVRRLEGLTDRWSSIKETYNAVKFAIILSMAAGNEARV
jgi:hypothetical protein